MFPLTSLKLHDDKGSAVFHMSSSERKDSGLRLVVIDENGNGGQDLSASSEPSLYDGGRWDISGRNVDSSISLSQVSLATTNTAEASSIFMDSRTSSDRLAQLSPETFPQEDSNGTASRPRPFSGGYYGTTLINEKHANYVLMYDMLTGIRIAVSILPV